MHAAELIWNSWENGQKIVSLPKKLIPSSRKEAYKIQENLEKFSNDIIVGWKIAATSKEGQKHIGVGGPLAGRILHNKLYKPEDTLIFGHNKMAVAEPEFAFKIGETLKPTKTLYNLEDVMKLVESLHLSIELPDSRFKNFATVGEFNLILDNACAHQFAISQGVDYPWGSLDLSKHKVKIYNSANLQHDGIGANVLGDPRIALTWLVNELSQNDITIYKGMIVSTGTCSMPLPIKSGDKITADFGDLGSISINTK